MLWYGVIKHLKLLFDLLHFKLRTTHIFFLYEKPQHDENNWNPPPQRNARYNLKGKVSVIFRSCHKTMLLSTSPTFAMIIDKYLEFCLRTNYTRHT